MVKKADTRVGNTGIVLNALRAPLCRRVGLYAAARLDRVSVRGLPDGNVRITKVGEWSSLRI